MNDLSFVCDDSWYDKSLFIRWKWKHGTISWFHESSPFFLLLGKRGWEGETLFLTFPLKQGRSIACRVYVWCFSSNKLSLEEKLKALLNKLNLYFHMVELKCMLLSLRLDNEVIKVKCLVKWACSLFPFENDTIDT